MKRILLMLLLFFVVLPGYPTVQDSDFILYKGKRWNVHTDAVEKYLDKCGISRFDICDGDGNGKPGNRFTLPTACWKGYYGVLEITEGVLARKLDLTSMILRTFMNVNTLYPARPQNTAPYIMNYRGPILKMILLLRGKLRSPCNVICCII